MTRTPSKNELRRDVRRRIIGLNDDARIEQNSYIAESVMEVVAQKSAALKGPVNVLLYHSLPDEPDTHRLVDRILEQGHNIFLPRVHGENLEIRSYTGRDSLEKGSYGIMEPCGDILDNLQVIDIAFIPGVAFTIDGKRLGRGKGYYDRLLPRLKAETVGICFSCQIVDYLPVEDHDMRVKSVILPCPSSGKQ